MDDTRTTVLLIDGHAEERKYWANWLNIASPEYRVLEAGTGAAGLDLCRSQRIDCVLLEATLPDMSGLQILVNLIPLASRPKIAVIMLTRLDLPPVAKLALSNGAQAYFVKSRASAERVDVAILKAIAAVGPMGKEHG